VDKLDTVNNIGLIRNALEHAMFELGSKKRSSFRIAKESRDILYRSLIEALKGSANLAVTGARKGIRSHKYQYYQQPWKEIHQTPIEGCEHAWRFSEPKPCEQPAMPKVDPNKRRRDDYLIGFYDALGMAQTECFMLHFTHSKVVGCADKEMRILEWLHENIRNEYEHFVPKTYAAPIYDLLVASELSLRLSIQLLFESGNVIHDGTQYELRVMFEQFLKAVKQEIEKLTAPQGTS
jgi:hypothetical protein